MLDAHRGVAGVGDSAKQPEAEKLAALSALYQLVATGMVSRPLLSQLAFLVDQVPGTLSD